MQGYIELLLWDLVGFFGVAHYYELFFNVTINFGSTTQ